MRSFGVLSIGIAVGFVSAALIFHGSNSEPPAAGVPEFVNADGSVSTDGPMVAASRSMAVNEAVKEESTWKPLDPEAADAAARRVIENALRKKAELGADYGAAETRQKLIAAGFRPDRAEWLVQRV